VQQLEKMADLERSSREQLEKINLLEVRVETLEQDYSALQEKASKLQDKAKTLAKEKVFLPGQGYEADQRLGG